MKRLILGATVLVVALSLSGCGSSDSDNSSSDNKSSNLFGVEIEADQTKITMNWKRTGDAIYYSHTDLTASNSIYDTQQIAKTNSTENIDVICSKELETGSYVQYSCSSSNLSYSSSMTLSLDEKTSLEERGYYDNTSHGQVILGYFQYTNGNLNFIQN